MAVPVSFYALERRAWLSNRRFKIIVAEGALCGAHVGQPPGNSSAGVGFAGIDAGVAGCVFTLLLLPVSLLLDHFWERRYREREAYYLAIDPLDPDFLAHDKGNFQLLCPQIESIVFKPQWRFYSSKPLPHWNVEVRERGGSVRHFSLTSADALEDVLDRVRALNVRVETEG